MVHAGHKPTTEHAGLWRQMGLVHSFVVLLYTAIFLAWSVWRDAKGKSWMKPIARFVAIEQSSPQSSWLRNPRHNSAANLPDKGAGCEWFEATWAGVEQSVIDDAIDQSRRHPLQCFHLSQMMTFSLARIFKYLNIQCDIN